MIDLTTTANKTPAQIIADEFAAADLTEEESFLLMKAIGDELAAYEEAAKENPAAQRRVEALKRLERIAMTANYKVSMRGWNF